MGRQSRRQARQVATRSVEAPARPTDPRVVVERQLVTYSGPIPNAEELTLYERIEPGLAGRIVGLSERAVDIAGAQSEHRQAMERLALEGLDKRANRGQHYALIVVLAFLACSVLLIMAGHGLEGAILGTLDLVSLAGLFVYGRFDQMRQEKRRTQTE